MPPCMMRVWGIRVRLCGMVMREGSRTGEGVEEVFRQGHAMFAGSAGSEDYEQRSLLTSWIEKGVLFYRRALGRGIGRRAVPNLVLGSIEKGSLGSTSERVKFSFVMHSDWSNVFIANIK